MILFGELYFFVCAGLLLIPALVLGIMEKPIKYYGFFVTIVFILLALWNKPTEIFYMAGYLIFQFIIITLFLRIRLAKGRTRCWFWTFITLSLAPLVLYKIA